MPDSVEVPPIAQGEQCKNALHEHLMPDGYLQAAMEADLRFADGWENLQCPDCGRFGWRKP